LARVQARAAAGQPCILLLLKGEALMCSLVKRSDCSPQEKKIISPGSWQKFWLMKKRALLLLVMELMSVFLGGYSLSLISENFE